MNPDCIIVNDGDVFSLGLLKLQTFMDDHQVYNGRLGLVQYVSQIQVLIPVNVTLIMRVSNLKSECNL